MFFRKTAESLSSLGKNVPFLTSTKMSPRGMGRAWRWGMAGRLFELARGKSRPPQAWALAQPVSRVVVRTRVVPSVLFNPPVPTADNIGGGVFNSGLASAGPSFDFAHSGTYSAVLKIDTSPAFPWGNGPMCKPAMRAGLSNGGQGADKRGHQLIPRRRRMRPRRSTCRLPHERPPALAFFRG
jgi:hypothetical protein